MDLNTHPTNTPALQVNRLTKCATHEPNRMIPDRILMAKDEKQTYEILENLFQEQALRSRHVKKQQIISTTEVRKPWKEIDKKS